MNSGSKAKDRRMHDLALERNRLRQDMIFIAAASRPNSPATYMVEGQSVDQVSAIHLRAISALKRENVIV